MKKGFRSLNIRICALAIALWLACAGFLTWAVAQDFQNQIYSAAQELLWSQHEKKGDLEGSTPGEGSLKQIAQLGYPYSFLRTEALLPVVLDQSPKSYSSKDWFWDEWELLYGFQAVTVFYDEAGEPMIKSGNLMSMHYFSEKNWDGKNLEYQGSAYIDLDKLPADLWLEVSDIRRDSPWGIGPSDDIFGRVLRAKGYFSGDEFLPVFLDVGWPLEHGGVNWENQLTLEAPPDVELETVYAWETGGSAFHHKAVTVGGKAYPSLVDFALENGDKHSLGNLIQTVFTLSAKAPGDTGANRWQLTVMTWPLQYAMLRMIPFYLVGSLAVALCLWLLLRSIQNNVVSPLKSMNVRAEAGYQVMPRSNWKEIRQAEERLLQSQNQVHSLQNDIQQLNAGLEYARNAEENRRQLVSNIAHELKTPLAVIHGYAEGLQAGIAEEKKEYYLDTILEESEKMDAMVLEMLDLSRLEAGKVRLSMDHFSMLALAKEILNKLAPEESRVHQISVSFSNDCMVVADEGRIGQVMTNLISNALKYTPEGGNIGLQVYADEGTAHFRIVNTGKHLPEEALEKIFESFYRVDTARSQKGTGLGLPIARSIIQLHRGTLTARNVWDRGTQCLEFAFEIPVQ